MQNDKTKQLLEDIHDITILLRSSQNLTRKVERIVKIFVICFLDNKVISTID